MFRREVRAGAGFRSDPWRSIQPVRRQRRAAFVTQGMTIIFGLWCSDMQVAAGLTLGRMVAMPMNVAALIAMCAVVGIYGLVRGDHHVRRTDSRVDSGRDHEGRDDQHQGCKQVRQCLRRPGHERLGRWRFERKQSVIRFRRQGNFASCGRKHTAMETCRTLRNRVPASARG